MKIFENKLYTQVMYLSITIIILLILFNLVNIFENNKQLIQKNNEKRIITGLLIAEQEAETNQTSANQFKQQELYTEKSYFIYYLLITVICGFIFVLSLKFILPKIREYT